MGTEGLTSTGNVKVFDESKGRTLDTLDRHTENLLPLTTSPPKSRKIRGTEVS